jgi:hypothetical protein
MFNSSLLRSFALSLCLLGGQLSAAEPCVSGPNQGQRPGPYAAVISTGSQRGQSHCFVCENADRPAVVVFARSLTDPLGKLVKRIDQAVAEHKAANLNAWVTILAADQPTLDPKVVDWGKQHAVATVPLGVFEDPVGPPSYRIHRDADVTVLLFVNRKVVANFAFRAGELSDVGTADVLKALPQILPEKK